MAPPSLNEAISFSEPTLGARLFRFFNGLGSGCEPLESLRLMPTGAEEDGGTFVGDTGPDGLARD